MSRRVDSRGWGLGGALLAVMAVCLLGWLVGAGPAVSASSVSESDRCVSPDAEVADGFVGSSYVKLRVQQESASEVWICFRAHDPVGLDLGGRVIVSAGSASVDPPVIDTEAGACPAADGNQLPGPRPLLSGEVGDPEEPPHAPYLVDLFADDEQAWFCLGVGELERRVVVPVPGVQAPDVVLHEDDPPAIVPPPVSPPVGYPSGTCQAGVGGEHDQAVNMGVGGGLHVWLEAWRPGISQAHLCVRLQGDLPVAGPLGVGGMLSLDASASPGITPVLIPGEDLDPCPLNVFFNQQADIEIKRSLTGENPASLCVRQGTTERSLTVGATGTLVPPTVNWAPDPDPLP